MVLVSDPIALHVYPAAHGYRKYTVVPLDDFLPPVYTPRSSVAPSDVIDPAESPYQMRALLGTNQVLLVATSNKLAFLLGPFANAPSSASTPAPTSAAAAVSAGSAPTIPLLVWALPVDGTVTAAGALLKLLAPGFRMPGRYGMVGSSDASPALFVVSSADATHPSASGVVPASTAVAASASAAGTMRVSTMTGPSNPLICIYGPSHQALCFIDCTVLEHDRAAVPVVWTVPMPFSVARVTCLSRHSWIIEGTQGVRYLTLRAFARPETTAQPWVMLPIHVQTVNKHPMQQSQDVSVTRRVGDASVFFPSMGSTQSSECLLMQGDGALFALATGASGSIGAPREAVATFQGQVTQVPNGDRVSSSSSSTSTATVPAEMGRRVYGALAVVVDAHTVAVPTWGLPSALTDTTDTVTVVSPAVAATTTNAPSASTTAVLCLSVVDFEQRTVRHVALPHEPKRVGGTSTGLDMEALLRMQHHTTSHMSSASSTSGPIAAAANPTEAREAIQNRMLALNGPRSVFDTPSSGGPVEPPTLQSPVVAITVIPSSAHDSPDPTVVIVAQNGWIQLIQVSTVALRTSLALWRSLFGEVRARPLRLETASDKKKEAKGPKEGKKDDKNEPHQGGNTWKGGTGGADTAGLGGKGGPYRFDAGHNVSQLSDEEKAKVSEEVKKAAREMGQAELRKRLQDIDMTPFEASFYDKYYGKVSREVSQLRLILESTEAKQRGREWIKHQQIGELDDEKLVDGMSGYTQKHWRGFFAVVDLLCLVCFLASTLNASLCCFYLH